MSFCSDFFITLAFIVIVLLDLNCIFYHQLNIYIRTVYVSDSFIVVIKLKKLKLTSSVLFGKYALLDRSSRVLHYIYIISTLYYISLHLPK